MRDQAVVRASAFDVVLAQSALWALAPWAPVAIGGVLAGPLSDQTSGALLMLGVGIMALMVWRLRRVGVYIEDDSVVVRNVLWTHRLASPVRRGRWHSSWWAVKPREVAVLRSDLSSRRCKAFSCQQQEDLDDLLHLLAQRGMMKPVRGGARRKDRKRR